MDDSQQPLVMVVDDDESVRRSLHLLLSAAGYAVASYSSGVDALKHESEEPPACVLLDVAMPDMNGLDVRDAMCEQGRDTATVFITGHDDVPSGVRAMKSGADDYLIKPFGDEEVLDAVRRAVTREMALRTERRHAAEIGQRYDALTPREHEVCDRVVDGRLNKQIAAELGTCEQTVKVHRCRVMRKMHATSLPDLVRAVDLFRRTGIQAPYRLNEGTMGASNPHAVP